MSAADLLTQAEIDRLRAMIFGWFPEVPVRTLRCHGQTWIDWSPPKGERIGGVPPWQGGYLLERAA